MDWELAADTPDGNLYFYRSASGLPKTWSLLNEGAPMSGRSGTFLDYELGYPALSTNTQYRAMIDPGGGEDSWIGGPAVRATDAYTPAEFNVARAILRREYLSMKQPSGNGIRAFHFVPRGEGDVASNVDPDTLQVLGPSCPSDPDSGFGTPYKGGFYPPVQTWVRKISIAPFASSYRPDGSGEDVSDKVAFRLLAHPRPESGHLIVLPGSGEFYVLDDPTERFYLRGVIPLFWECQGKLLDTADIRRQIEIPALLSD